MKNSYYIIIFYLVTFCGISTAQIHPVSSNNEIVLSSLVFGSNNMTIDNIPLSNYHFFNPYYYNPAMAGIENKRQLNLDWNRQHKNSYLVSYEQPINSINSAIGVFASATFTHNISVKNYGVAYNYSFNLEKDVKLKFGIQFSQTHFSMDEYLTQGEGPTRKWYAIPSMDIGTAFQVKQLRFGVSIQNLFPVKIFPDYIFSEIINGTRQLNFSAANTFKLSKKWDWSLAFLLRVYDHNYDHLNSYIINDYSSYFSFRKKYFIGITFRTEFENHWITFVGIKIKEKFNIQLSAQKDEYQDDGYLETLVQYQF